ncbi:hypothetical protein, partial [uncultured Cellulomonas sp.]|uniref:hypothetical protein n=1 Tax=uncultured Cellulomonas sp. TaxID=189682 RepID=UPI0028E2E99D
MTPAPAHWTGSPWGARSSWVAIPAAFLALVTLVGAAGANRWNPQGRPFDALSALLLVLAPAAVVLVVRGGVLAVVGALLAVSGPTAFVALGHAPGPAYVPLGVVVVALGVTRQRPISVAAGAAGVVAVLLVSRGAGSPSPVWATVTVAGLSVAMLLGEG